MWGEEASEKSACANASMRETTAMMRRGSLTQQTPLELVCGGEARPECFEREG